MPHSINKNENYLLEIKNLTLEVNGILYLSKFSYNFARRNMYTFEGNISSGKSLLFATLAKTFQQSSGEIIYNFFSQEKMAAIFQTPAVISNLSLFQNLCLIYDFHYPNKPLEEKHHQIKELVAEFKLTEKINLRPSLLSTGELFLISFMRAMIINPILLLWDNPFNNIDDAFHKIIEQKLDQIIQNNGTVILFTNNLKVKNIRGNCVIST